MPTRLLLDGDDLATLMHRVRAEMGPNAVVVRAERVRTGGLAGFFAKEHFELTVEVPDRPARIPRRQSVHLPAVGSGLAGLLDAADAEEAWDAGQPAPAADFVPMPMPMPATATGAGASPSGTSPTGPPDGSSPAAVPTGPRVSTDADTFATLLASIDDMADVPKPPDPVDVPKVPDAGADAGDADLPSAAPDPRFLPREAPPGPTSTTTPAPTAAPPRAGGGDRRALLGLGVPAALLGAGGLDETMPLSDLLGRLVRPPALLRDQGSIIAVVGEGAQALEVATQFAIRLRQDPHDVVLAGQMHAAPGHARRLLSPTAAAQHRARFADGEQVSIVAVGVGSEPEDWSVAAELLADLGPDQAWAVVDARRKTADLRAWLRVVGRAREFDVAAAGSVHETQEPGTMLDLGLPIGWIDGLPATPVVWAAMLSERLAAGARWD
ncbi:hypothetical protein [Pengzhenrongella frigida]|uniref:Uncharacterized protein n=1 Tax=Pengzhenrongella frigida TaxID=1259133 RepID=A0A4Q5MWQ9_9MICO|nr:hypothetical protein [Cellulomonas sp. HLT2-17]RYV50005.1 hypothetical protein EUA98_15665 [Cellulomonas sp. HLT2-17]